MTRALDRQWRRQKRWFKWLRFGGLLFLSLVLSSLSAWLSPAIATPPAAFASVPSGPLLRTEGWVAETQTDAQQTDLLQDGQRLYENGELEAAATMLQQAVETYQSAGDRLRQAAALANLALVYGQQGNWDLANQTIAASQTTIGSVATGDRQMRSVQAQTLDIQGRLHYAQGQQQAAYETWQQTAQLYQQLGDQTRWVRSLIRQAKALQAQGFYLRSVTEILQPLTAALQQQPDSLSKVTSLHTLGEALVVAGDLSSARQTVNQAIRLAEQLAADSRTEPSQQPALQQAIAAARLTLGNILKFTDTTAALNEYAQVVRLADPANQVRAKLNLLSLFIEQNRFADAPAVVADLQTQLATLPPNQDTLESQIHFVYDLLAWKAATRSSQPSDELLFDQLAIARDQAIKLNHKRSIAYVTGAFGQAYTLNQDFEQARTATEAALFLAKSINAKDITYRWYDQLGEILEQQRDRSGAIAAYSGAVETLKALRADLANVNPDVQFSFKENIEPIHRKLVSLLLDADSSDGNNLDQARRVIESLRVEELNDYLRAACLDRQEVDLEEIASNQQVAVVYPIILEKQLAIITSLPRPGTGTKQVATTANQANFKLYRQDIAATQIQAQFRQLRQAFSNRVSLGFREAATTAYDLLIRPMELDLASANVQTLVFVLDGAMRSVPMAALLDSQTNEYLIEKYSIALTPGIELFAPRPLQSQQLSVLAFGLSEGITVSLPDGGSERFSDLPNVETELQEIKTYIPNTQAFINEAFTPTAFAKAVESSSAPILHLATHGQFSSENRNTFIVARSQEPIFSEKFTTILQSNELNRSGDIELLVLSACETAAGDERAALGLAGLAVRAGARSTLASLWQVDDVATSLLMGRFYESLSTRQVTKAEALRQAQLAILENPRFRRHPYYWAPFVLIGNWL
ncbi:CHAT domain-containing protein [Almyronema epifaneia]|uniref:CHAT domain-containing protein n=1 Tax=Almyronema epifaneia S1 TaxID=2991925 RepID=A0ABW6IE74_9CYAN